MKRSYVKIALMLIIAFSLLVFGCKNIRLSTYNDSDSKSNDKKTGQTQEINENTPSEKKKDTKEDDENKDKSNGENEDEDEILGRADSPTSIVLKPTENMELVVYTVNNNTEVVPATAAVPKNVEITPQLIVDTVKEAMAETSLMIGIESVTTEGNAVIVSFYSDQPPLVNIGAGYETAILDAIAQSLVENLDDYNKVIYRVEGEAYSSGHIELGIDEVYLVD